MSRFQIGDRVIWSGAIRPSFKTITGTVIGIPTDSDHIHIRTDDGDKMTSFLEYKWELIEDLTEDKEIIL